MMRILEVSSARALGGGERHLIDLVNGLTRRGHKVYAAVGPNSPLSGQLSVLPCENVLEVPLRNSFDLASARKLAQFAGENQIEIIHAHRARDYPLAAIATRQAGAARLLITRHVLFPLSPIHKVVLRRVARVIAVSLGVADGLVARRIFKRDQIVVIHNGIDFARFETNEKLAGKPDDRSRFTVGMVGELSPIKGQEDFLKAAAIISAIRNDVDFVISGQDASRNGKNRARLERLVDELSLRERVRITGWADDIGKLLRTFDLFVSASHSESFGIAMVEAMACGVPVVATTTTGAREIIDEDMTGRLFPIADAEALAAAVGELLNDRNERERLAKNARRKARERFSLEQMVDKTEHVFELALHRSTAC